MRGPRFTPTPVGPTPTLPSRLPRDPVGSCLQGGKPAWPLLMCPPPPPRPRGLQAGSRGRGEGLAEARGPGGDLGAGAGLPSGQAGPLPGPAPLPRASLCRTNPLGDASPRSASNRTDSILLSPGVKEPEATGRAKVPATHPGPGTHTDILFLLRRAPRSCLTQVTLPALRFLDPLCPGPHAALNTGESWGAVPHPPRGVGGPVASFL